MYERQRQFVRSRTQTFGGEQHKSRTREEKARP